MKKPLSPSTIPLEQESQPPAQRRTQSFKVADNLIASFGYAWAGVSYAFVTQRNFRIHTLIGSVALGLGIYLGLPPVDLAVVGLTSGLVLVMELLNTALEAVVDLTVQQTYHQLAKIAKDCAAASVLISALVAVVVAGLLLLPPLGRVLSAAGIA